MADEEKEFEFPVGIIFSGIESYIKEKKSEKFQEYIKQNLTEIETALGTITADLNGIKAQVNMDQLYANTGNAEAKINVWWGENYNKTVNGAKVDKRGEVLKWIQDGTPIESEVAQHIHDNGTTLLDNIHQATIQGLTKSPNATVSGKWLDCVIQLMKARSNEHQPFPTSICELSFRYFLYLQQLQLRGLAALVAIDYDLKEYTKDHFNRTRFSTQAQVCQEIVNGYKDDSWFLWYGDNGLPAGESDRMDCDGGGLFAHDMGGPGDGKSYAIVEIRFGWSPYKHFSNRIFGPSPGVAKLTADREVDETTFMPQEIWAPVTDRNSSYFYKFQYCEDEGDFHNRIAYDTSELVCPAGTVLSLIKTSGDYEDKTYSDSGDVMKSRGYTVNTVSLEATCVKVGKDGQLMPKTAAPAVRKGGGEQRLYEPDAGPKPPNFTMYTGPTGIDGQPHYAPATGIKLTQRGDQLAFALQCRFHLNSFVLPPKSA